VVGLSGTELKSLGKGAHHADVFGGWGARHPPRCAPSGWPGLAPQPPPAPPRPLACFAVGSSICRPPPGDQSSCPRPAAPRAFPSNRASAAAPPPRCPHRIPLGGSFPRGVQPRDPPAARALSRATPAHSGRGSRRSEGAFPEGSSRLSMNSPHCSPRGRRRIRGREGTAQCPSFKPRQGRRRPTRAPTIGHNWCRNQDQVRGKERWRRPYLSGVTGDGPA
jgi:hypothetical protein